MRNILSLKSFFSKLNSQGAVAIDNLVIAEVHFFKFIAYIYILDFFVPLSHWHL
jgi:hypothetical protein